MSGVIEAINLKKIFPSPKRELYIVALDGVALDIQEGEIYGFLGPNGAGKTTAIKILLGLTFPDEGEVKIRGSSIRESNSRVRMSYLPEEHYFYAHLKVDKFLHLMAQIIGLTEKDHVREEVLRVMEMFELMEIKSQKIGKLSKGQRQRVALAQVFLGDPDILFLDEPSSGLDPLWSKRLSSIVKDYQAKGKTVFLSSHQLSEVELVCDRIGLIKDGRMVLEGRTSELLREKEKISLEELFLSTYVGGDST